jgi:hypothetical protein
MKTYEGVDICIHVFLSSALFGGEWSASLPGCFTPRKEPQGTHWTGSCMGPRTGLENAKRRKILPLPGLEIRGFGRPARSQPLSRLRFITRHLQSGESHYLPISCNTSIKCIYNNIFNIWCLRIRTWSESPPQYLQVTARNTITFLQCRRNILLPVISIPLWYEQTSSNGIVTSPW